MSEEFITTEASVEPTAGAMTAIGRTLGSVMEAGREILARRRQAVSAPPNSAGALVSLCQQLLDHRGEASGLVLASEITAGYRQLPESDRMAFFSSLASKFEVDASAILAAAEQYRDVPDLDNLWSINRAVEAPRVKLFRRINMVPDGTRTLVAMRGHLLQVLR